MWLHRHLRRDVLFTCFSLNFCLVPRTHRRQRPQSTLSPAHAWGKCRRPHLIPRTHPRQVPRFPRPSAHTRGRCHHTHSPGEGLEEPPEVPTDPELLSTDVLPASLEGKLSPSDITPGPPRLGRGSSVWRVAGPGAQSPRQDSPPPGSLPPFAAPL